AKNGEQTLGNRVVLVGGGENLDVAAALADQPYPSAAELLDSGIVEFGLKILEVAESLLDGIGDGAAGVAAAFRLHDLPEHTVIYMTAAVVAHGGTDVFRHGVQVANQILGTLGLQFGMFFQSSIQVLDVSCVMHVVVQLHGCGINGGLKCGVVVG